MEQIPGLALSARRCSPPGPRRNPHETAFLDRAVAHDGHPRRKDDTMSDTAEERESEDFATLFAREGARQVLEIGQVVKGRILQIGDETVFVDVGGKGEALIDRAELVDDQGNMKLAIGDEIEATVVRAGDEVRLSYRLLQGLQTRQGLAIAAETGLPVEG